MKLVDFINGTVDRVIMNDEAVTTFIVIFALFVVATAIRGVYGN